MTSTPLFSHTSAGGSPAAGPAGLARQGASFKSDVGLAPSGATLYEGSNIQTLEAWLTSSCAGGTVCIHLEGLGPLECRWETTDLAVSLLRPDGIKTALALPREAWATRGGINPIVKALWAPTSCTTTKDSAPKEGP